jgi:hypothetical protein
MIIMTYNFGENRLFSAVLTWAVGMLFHHIIVIVATAILISWEHVFSIYKSVEVL